jgi:hypothetical protein
LLDGIVLSQQVFDPENLSHHTNRVEAPRSLVLALLSDPLAARQKSELYILPESRLAQSEAVILEQGQDLAGREAS